MGCDNAGAGNRELGAELRKRREAAGLTGAAVADYTGWDRSKVSRVESGHIGVNPVDAGLLQTRDYARALFNTEARRDADDVAHCVELRIARQQILNRPPSATFTFFVHETALRREVGGREVLQEQLLHLVLLAALPHVTLRVIPTSTPTPIAVGGPFQLFTWPQHHPLVYLDNPACGVFVEDEEFVTPFRDLVRLTATTALEEAPSREWVASVANELDQANEDHGIHGIGGIGGMDGLDEGRGQ